MLKHSICLSIICLFLMGCDDEDTVSVSSGLIRPSDITFACYGKRDSNDSQSEAIPTEFCGNTSDDGNASLYEFVLQGKNNSVAIMRANLVGISLIDSSPTIPGFNTITVGPSPVGMVTDSSGCYLITANRGTCDLSQIDVTAAIKKEQNVVTQHDIVDLQGTRIEAMPTAIGGLKYSIASEQSCQDKAAGYFYVAYPTCNMVAIIDANSGQVKQSVVLSDMPEVIDGIGSCESTCNDSNTEQTIVLNADYPTKHLVIDSPRLLIGASNRILVVELTEEGLVESVRHVDLEGDVNVTALTTTGRIDMGNNGTSGVSDFVYASVTDKTIRVVSLSVDDAEPDKECDTQIDPRYLYEQTDASYFSCIEVTEENKFLRRATAQSGGITLPNNAIPFDVQVFSVDNGTLFDERVDPLLMQGHFGFISASDGSVYVMNINDNHYMDVEIEDTPIEVTLPLALPHQLRDVLKERDAVFNTCENLAGDTILDSFGARLGTPVQRNVVSNVVDEEYTDLLPRLRQVACEDVMGQETFVSEMSLSAPENIREQVFPDLALVKNETWTWTWEGELTTSNSFNYTQKTGKLLYDNNQIKLIDNNAPFCDMGASSYDVLTLSGCRSGLECPIDSVCVFPDNRTESGHGLCFDKNQADQKQTECSQFIGSNRRYSIAEIKSDEVVLMERRRILRTTPMNGCDSDIQCQMLADLEIGLASSNDFVDPISSEYQFSCEPDISRKAVIDRCIMICSSDDECEEGFACSNNYCVEGVLPSTDCFDDLQPYNVEASDSFTIQGSETGLLHNKVIDPDTGLCVESQNNSPWTNSRLSLLSSDCNSEDNLIANEESCRVQVEHTEEAYLYDEQAETCYMGIRTGMFSALRFSNPVFTTHLITDPIYKSPECYNDFDEMLVSYPELFLLPSQGRLSFSLIGGFSPMRLLQDAVVFPKQLVHGPNGFVWGIDQGNGTTSSSYQGRVFRLNPSSPESGFSPLFSQ